MKNSEHKEQYSIVISVPAHLYMMAMGQRVLETRNLESTFPKLVLHLLEEYTSTAGHDPESINKEHGVKLPN